MTWLRRILCALGWHGEPTWFEPDTDHLPMRVCPHCSAIHTDRRPR